MLQKFLHLGPGLGGRAIAQRGIFGGAKRTDGAVALQKRSRLGDIELPVMLEAPSIEADRKIICDDVVAGVSPVLSPKSVNFGGG